jgi:tRNA(Arg) A34 adenosine deaminase TadA
MLQETGAFSTEEKIFMTRANEIALARVREAGGGPFAALIVYDQEIISEGWNRVTLDNDPTAHAEIVAIRSACAKLGRYNLAGCHVYSTCEPCPMCLGAIYWAHLAGIYYSLTRTDASRIGFDDEFIYEEFSLPPAHRKIPSIRIMTENANLAFVEWERNPGKRY